MWDQGLGLDSGSYERLPVVRQEFIQPVDRVRRDAREHISEPGKRLNAAPFAGSDKASQHRRRSLAALVAAEEGPAAAAAVRLARSMAPLSISSSPSSRKRVSAPLNQRLADGHAIRALRQELLLQTPADTGAVSPATATTHPAALASRCGVYSESALARSSTGQAHDQVQLWSHTLIRLQRPCRHTFSRASSTQPRSSHGEHVHQ